MSATFAGALGYKPTTQSACNRVLIWCERPQAIASDLREKSSNEHFLESACSRNDFHTGKPGNMQRAGAGERRGSFRAAHSTFCGYFPKRTDLSGYTQADLDKVALRLNQRPRKTLGFKLQRVNFNKVLRRPSELARLIRWDEKAGLQRDAIRSH
jgi:hypothetical protein